MNMLFKYDDRSTHKDKPLHSIFYGKIHTMDYGDINLIHNTKSNIEDITHMIDNFIDEGMEKKILNYNFFILGEEIEEKISRNEAIIKTQIFNRLRSFDVNYYADSGNTINIDYNKLKNNHLNKKIRYDISHHINGQTNIRIFYHEGHKDIQKFKADDIINSIYQEYGEGDLRSYYGNSIDYFITSVSLHRISAFLWEIIDDGFKTHFSHTYIPKTKNFYKYQGIANNIYCKFFIFNKLILKDMDEDIVEYGKAKMIFSPHRILPNCEKEKLKPKLKNMLSYQSFSDREDTPGEDFYIHVIFGDGEIYAGASIPFDTNTAYNIKNKIHFLNEFESIAEFKKLIPYILVGEESNKCNCLIHNQQNTDDEYSAGPLYCPVCGRHNAKNVTIYNF